MNHNNNNNNIDHSNMTKNVKTKIEYLKEFATVINSKHKNKVDNLINLYATRKITRYETIKNQLADFIKYETAGEKNQTKYDKKYNSFILKHSDIKPLAERKTITKQKKVDKQNIASKKIQKLFKNGIGLHATISDKALKENVIKVDVKPKYLSV